MIAPDRQRVAQLLDQNVAELTELALGDRPSPTRREVVSRVLSLLLDRYLLEDSAAFWEDLGRLGRQPLYVVLEGIDTLEHAAFDLLRARVDSLAAPAVIRTLEGMLDEIRAEHVRLLHVSDQKSQILDVSVLEDIPESVFILPRSLVLDPLNRAARLQIAGLGTPKCHVAFFGRDHPCDGCPLDRVIESGAPVTCPGPFGFSVRLRPFTGQSVVAWLADAPHSLRPRELPESLGLDVLDHLGSGVMFVDSESTVLYANAVAREVLGDTLLGSSVHSVLPNLVLTEDKKQHQLHVQLKNGLHTLLGYRCVQCDLDGKHGTVVTFRDITELERLRKDMDQLERLSEIGQMCAMVAHEIRNPLAGIKATIQSVEKEAQAAGLQPAIEVIGNEVDRLAELLSGFFAFVRQRPPRKRPTNVPTLIAAARRSAGPRLNGVHIELDLAPRLPEVWVDSDQMQQVLINLLVNAAEALPSGRGTITVGAAMAGNDLLLTVEDDGCGVGEGNLERVFEAFFTTKSGGTGLGLPICYRIVSAHRGEIAIESAEDKGTLVEVRVPAFDRI